MEEAAQSVRGMSVPKHFKDLVGESPEQAALNSVLTLL